MLTINSTFNTEEMNMLLRLLDGANRHFGSEAAPFVAHFLSKFAADKRAAEDAVRRAAEEAAKAASKPESQ